VADTAEQTAYRQRIDAFLACRDAGHEVTVDMLRAGINLTAITDSAQELAAFCDEAQQIVAGEYAPVLACQAGCAYCCRKPGVLVTLPELLRLLHHVEGLDAEARSSVVERSSAYVAALDGRSFDVPTNDSIPCPLLLNERCSVYDVRPLVCRGYNSTDAAACRRAHDDGRHGVPIFAPLKDVTDGASVGVVEALAEAGRDEGMFDLGTALHLALTSRRSAAALAGDTLCLSAARNATWARDLLNQVQTVAREL
jgi:Fe-S-cluster containining protein